MSAKKNSGSTNQPGNNEKQDKGPIRILLMQSAYSHYGTNESANPHKVGTYFPENIDRHADK